MGAHPGRHSQIETQMDEMSRTRIETDDVCRKTSRARRAAKTDRDSSSEKRRNLGFALRLGAMAKASGSANVDPMGKGGIEKSTGFNPGLIVLIVVVGALLIFGVGNFFLYQYAQKNAPLKKKKPVSQKKLKKERLKGGVRPAGD